MRVPISLRAIFRSSSVASRSDLTEITLVSTVFTSSAVALVASSPLTEVSSAVNFSEVSSFFLADSSRAFLSCPCVSFNLSVTTFRSPCKSALVFSSCASRSRSADTSCCTDCCSAFSWFATDCCVLSNFDDAFQPNPKPPSAIKPSTTIAGSCHPGSVLVSTILSSLIVYSSPHPSICLGCSKQLDPMYLPNMQEHTQSQPKF